MKMETDLHQYALRFAQKFFLNKVFVGHYIERRYVERIKTYRDVIIIDESENEFMIQLKVVKEILLYFCGDKNIRWIGITGPGTYNAPDGHALWVKLNNIPFGTYKFKITGFRKIADYEIISSVKLVRDKNMKEVEESKDPKNKNQTVMSRFCGTFRKVFCTEATKVFSVENLKKTICFISVLFLASVVGLLHLTKLLGLYSLKLIHQVTLLLQALSPYFLSIVDFCTKCVGGLYILFAMMWRDRNRIRVSEQGRQIQLKRRPTHTQYGS